MRMSAARTMSIAAVVAVAVLGTAYASGASSHNNAPSNAAVTGLATAGSAPSSGGSLSAITAPVRNIAHVFGTSDPGGSGQVTWTVPNPGRGTYAASFTANFYPAGSAGAPVRFSCFLLRNSAMLSQSTVPSTSTGGFYVGVNGGNTLSLKNATTVTVGCGTDDNSAWTWGTRSVQVTLTRLDGRANGSVFAPSKQPASASIASR
jgi:hypothetical protein